MNVKSECQIWRADSHEQELEARAEIIYLGVAGEDGAPNSNFSKIPELSETSRARKLVFRLQVNIDNNIISTKPTIADMTLLMGPS